MHCRVLFEAILLRYYRSKILFITSLFLIWSETFSFERIEKIHPATSSCEKNIGLLDLS